MIQKQFITYNLKIKGNASYPILPIEDGLPPIESMAMFKYLMYIKNTYNVEAKRLTKVSSKPSQNPHLNLKHGWYQDT